MEAATALPFTKIRHHSSPITAANFYWTFTVVRQFSEHIASINSFNPLNNFSEKILLPFFRWVTRGTEGCVTCSDSHRELGIVKQGKWHEVPYAIVSILLCLLLLQPSPSVLWSKHIPILWVLRYIPCLCTAIVPWACCTVLLLCEGCMPWFETLNQGFK